MTSPRAGYEIRPEIPSDIDAIRALHLSAFPTPAEADLVDRLRREGDLTISLVAETEDGTLGHIGFSAMKAPFRALGLAPLAVATDAAGQGIGSALVRLGLESATDRAFRAVFVLGDPGFYGRFGFSVERAHGYLSPYAGPYLMMRVLGPDNLPKDGHIEYARAFSDL
ncbi:MAG: N-acetyltransferase [Alphaproteobacteria bacterium]|nr:N-acetyltransferase [Alphaproteobacteria bacterium]